MKNYFDVLEDTVVFINSAKKGLEDLEKGKDALPSDLYNLLKSGYIEGVKITAKKCVEMSNIELNDFSMKD